MDLKILEEELLKLSPKEKAAITYKLLASLENEKSENVDDIWIDEALSRYNQVKENRSLLIDSELIIKEAKSRYK